MKSRSRRTRWGMRCPQRKNVDLFHVAMTGGAQHFDHVTLVNILVDVTVTEPGNDLIR